MRTSDAIKNAIRVLLYRKEINNPNKWQAVEIKDPMYEINNVFLDMDICKSIDVLSLETKADLPWSEDHFQERLNGASNPGEQYKNWPYYSKETDDNRFRTNGLFSHTYQERFWPLKVSGNRFKMGDWNDIKDRLSSDATSRQAFFSIWHPEDHSNNNVRLPCTIGYWFNVRNNELNLTYLIRSCDARRHFRNDIYMTQRLAMDMLESINKTNKNVSLGKMTMWIGSFHCFVSDVYSLNKTL